MNMANMNMLGQNNEYVENAEKKKKKDKSKKKKKSKDHRREASDEENGQNEEDVHQDNSNVINIGVLEEEEPVPLNYKPIAYDEWPEDENPD